MPNHNTPHDSAALHVAGSAKFIDDIAIAGEFIHCKPILATINRGQILSMDFSAITQLPDVIGVLTAEDIRGINDVSPTGTHDEECLASKEIYFHGQVIGLVVAKTRQAAFKAAKLAKITYQESPAILSVDDAMAQQSFVLPPRTMQIGDAPNKIANCKHVIRGEFSFGGQDHFYLEGQISLVIPNEDNQFMVYCSTQHPTEVQNLVAHFLGLNAHKIVVETRRMGGGFGGKETQAVAFACLAALAAQKYQKPCKLRLDRDDDMMITGKRHGGKWQYQCGFDDDGKIQAVIASVMLDCGFSADLSGPICDRALYHADNAYHYPNAHLTAYPCKTHKVSNTAFRGFGGPQGVLLAERLIESIAIYTKKDALAIRQCNFYRDHDAKGDMQKTPYHQPIKDGVINKLVSELKNQANYDKKLQEIQKFNQSSAFKTRGIALTPVKFGISFTNTGMNQAGALVHLYTDGSLLINHGGTEMGQGLYQKTRQIAARLMGVSLDKVQICATNTSKVANTQPTAASAGTDLNGMAIKDAIGKIQSRLIGFIAEKYQCPADSIKFDDNFVHVNHEKIPLGKICFDAHWARVQLWDSGFYKTPDIYFDPVKYQGEPFYYYAYGAAQTQVEIDCLSGEYEILAVDILHDVGESLNPALDIGQITGGFVQGMGWLTTEELFWNHQGKLMTHAPSTYKIPTMRDIPQEFQVNLFKNTNQSATIFRSKAVGEPPLMLGISVFQALCNAVNQYRNNNGKLSKLINAPATAQEILLAMQ